MATEPCTLCGAQIPEEGKCRNPQCRAAWKAFDGPRDDERRDRARPASRDGERAADD